MNPDISDTIFSIKDRAEFLSETLKIFNIQSGENIVYREFTGKPGIMKSKPVDITGIPFLPVGFFRNFKVTTGSNFPEIIFESSGTTGEKTSRHYVTNTGLYRKSFSTSFSLFYGDPAEYCIVALLPSYLERQNSSLVYMMNDLIKSTKNSLSGFYSENIPDLLKKIDLARKESWKIILIGVSYALLDLAEGYTPDLSDVTVMETGGMKGKRKEITRQELHEILMEKLNVRSVHSEYGMTELLSQAYSKGEGIFHCPPWMQILIRDPLDPFEVTTRPGMTGGVNIIDLANRNSCSFIATDDLGRLHEDGSFELLGRLDNSDIRGCNLLTD